MAHMGFHVSLGEGWSHDKDTKSTEPRLLGSVNTTVGI